MRLLGWLLLVWGVDFFLLSLFPSFKAVVDLLLLSLVFLGFRLSSSRFLWGVGGGLGLLKDLASGGPVGVWSCTFALIGWLLGVSRHLLEREDPMVVGVWAGVLAGLSGFLYECLLISVDPAASWSGWWRFLPAAMLVQGAVAALSFPWLQRKLE